MIITIAPQTAPADVPEFVRQGGYCGAHRVPCSFFQDGVTDVSPINWAGTWAKLVQGFLREFPFEQGVPPSAAKRTLPAICGSEFQAGTSRRRDSAVRVGLLLGDVDNTSELVSNDFHLDPHGNSTTRPKMTKVPLTDPVTMAMVAGVLEEAGVVAFLWATWSSRPGNPRFRFAVPLAIPIQADLWPQASDYAIKTLGLEKFRHAIDIPVLRNPAALAFLPGSIFPEYLERSFVDGDPFHIPSRPLSQMAAPRKVLSPWQTNIVRQRSIQVGPRWWQAYLDGGRLDNFHTLDLPGIISGLGCSVGHPQPWKGGVKYRCTCPWHGEHTGGEDDDSAVVFMAPGSWPAWHCSHAGHGHMGLRDILELAWGRP